MNIPTGWYRLEDDVNKGSAPFEGARWVVATGIVVLGSLLASHVGAAFVRLAIGQEPSSWAPAGARLSWAAAILGILAGSLSSWESRPRVPALLGLGALLSWAVTAGTPWTAEPAWVLFVLAPLLGVLHSRVLKQLPSRLESDARLHPRWAALWLAVLVLGLVQMGRLSTFMTNPESNWFLSTKNSLYADHECANAYLFAAELQERGDANIYDPAHYPGLNPAAQPHTEMHHMAVEDPFLYPPQFLLLPAAARLLTHDYPAIRVLWFGLNVGLCLFAVFALCAWVGGQAGYLAALAAPLLLVAFPVLHNFQYGQFHFAALALAVVGVMALERGRRGVGGLALAVAIVSKLFPVLLLVPLAFSRRFRDLAAVGAWLLGISVAAWAAFGGDQFLTFVQFHLPRLRSGEAFAFGVAYPEIEHLVVAGNQGVAGIGEKLAYLGWALPSWWNEFASGAYLLAVIGAASALGQKGACLTRVEKAWLWLSILGMGSLLSRGAWSDYVPLSFVWMASFLIPVVVRSRLVSVAFSLILALQCTLLGTMPLGSFQDPWILVPVSLASALLLHFGFLSAMAFAWRSVRQREAQSETVVGPGILSSH